jgi:membrane-associated phospholipid phosphatase
VSRLPRLSVVAVFVAVCAVTILVQARALVWVDTRCLQLLDAARPAMLAGALDWAFRLAFVQVDLVIAAGWVGLRLLRRQGLQRVLAPAVLLLVIAVQVAVRLAVNQPAPGSSFALERAFADQAVSSVLDRGDLLSRLAFQAATTTLQTAATPPSFPSGHAARAFFLALLFTSAVRSGSGANPGDRRLVWGRLAALAGLGWAALVGYSALYFGYHWPSDVLAGYLLGIGGWQLAASPFPAAVAYRLVGRRPRLTTAGTG